MPGYAAIPSIRVQDVEAAVAFYRDVLGFEMQRSQDVSDNNALKFGEASIMIEAASNFYSDAYNAAIRERLGTPSASALYIEAPDLDALYSKVQGAGVRVVDPLAARDWGQREFTVEDPEGTWLTFWQAG